MGNRQIEYAGMRYKGEAVRGVPHGKGVGVWPSGDRYEGQFSRGRKEGKGTMKWSDGSVYEGDWKAGMYEGKGTLKYADGRVYEGFWKKGRQFGFGTRYNKEGGFVYQGDYRDNQPHGDCIVSIEFGNNTSVFMTPN